MTTLTLDFTLNGQTLPEMMGMVAQANGYQPVVTQTTTEDVVYTGDDITSEIQFSPGRKAMETTEEGIVLSVTIPVSTTVETANPQSAINFAKEILSNVVTEALSGYKATLDARQARELIDSLESAVPDVALTLV